MSSQIQEITQKTVGFSFHISIETEKRIETGAKYPDKVVTKASLGGHSDTYEGAVANLKKASEEIRKQIKEVEK